VTTDVDCQSVCQRVNNDDIKASTRITRITRRTRHHHVIMSSRINLIATMAIQKALNHQDPHKAIAYAYQHENS
jgi:ABC-type Zn uptake system ZnuABC Zn-binding protein ZnuA